MSKLLEQWYTLEYLNENGEPFSSRVIGPLHWSWPAASAQKEYLEGQGKHVRILPLHIGKPVTEPYIPDKEATE